MAQIEYPVSKPNPRRPTILNFTYSMPNLNVLALTGDAIDFRIR
jgi:hypothetical protein